ncbi:MAG: RNA 2',3'-cyclic phosphodiesterase [candidate division WOR-3 bacterium]
MSAAELVRSFVAVEVPVAVRQELTGLVEQLRSNTSLRVRWVRPEQMHLTLVFLGEVTPEFVAAAKGALADVAVRVRPMECQLAGCGAFPSLRRARVVWVGMERGKAELVNLQRLTSEGLSRIGYQPESRPFSAHLTLGRLREPADAGFLSSIEFQSSPFSVDRLVLFRSVLKPAGPEYSVLGEFKLSL